MFDLKAHYDEIPAEAEQFAVSYHGPKGTLTLSWTPVEPDPIPAEDQPRPPRDLIDKWKAESGGE